MRRKDREITDRNKIIDILQHADTIRLGINGDPYPYVVPLSFGFEDVNGEINIYIHGAKEGFKHTLLDLNNHVCVEASIFNGYVRTDTGLTTKYESVIGFGTVEVVQGAEAVRGMDLICSHCGYPGFEYDITLLDMMRIYKIRILDITGKKN